MGRRRLEWNEYGRVYFSLDFWVNDDDHINIADDGKFESAYNCKYIVELYCQLPLMAWANVMINFNHSHWSFLHSFEINFPKLFYAHKQTHIYGLLHIESIEMSSIMPSQPRIWLLHFCYQFREHKTNRFQPISILLQQNNIRLMHIRLWLFQLWAESDFSFISIKT